VEISNVQFGQNVAQSNTLQEAADQSSQAQERIVERELATNTVTETQENSAQADSQERRGEGSRPLEQAVQEVQEFVQSQARNLAFDIDDGTNRSIVTVSDTESGEVIRQIPSDEVLRLAERIQTLQQDIGASVGVFVNRQV